MLIHLLVFAFILSRNNNFRGFLHTADTNASLPLSAVQLQGRPRCRQALSSKFSPGSTNLWPFSLAAPCFCRLVEQYEAKHMRQEFTAFSSLPVQTSNATSHCAPVYWLSALFVDLIVCSTMGFFRIMFKSGILFWGTPCRCNDSCSSGVLYLWPQAVVTGFWNISMQMEHVKCFSSELMSLGDTWTEAISS